MPGSDEKDQHRRLPVIFWITLVRAVLAVVLGLALIVQPDRTRPMLVNFMGMFWLVSGIMSIRWGVKGGRAKGLPLAAGIVGVLAGLVAITRRAMFGLIDELVVLYLLGAVILLTGVLHAAGGFNVGESTGQRIVWPVFLLGVFEIVLGVLVLASPLDRGPVVHWIASIWALLGGVVLLAEALRQRARVRWSA
jgi:uncharacterized membrane protein HdeD (DUF308 family)